LRNLMLFLVLVISLLVGGGCATIRNSPPRAIDPWVDVDNLNGLFSLGGYLNLSGNPDKQKIYRNDLINARILAMDLNYEKFEASLVREYGLTELGTEWATLALTGASAVVPLAQTKTVLSAIAAGITGANASVGKNLLFKKTIEALITQMKADRKTVLLAIRQKMEADTSSYPVTAALIDLEDYYRAGTLPQAVSSISVTAGATVKEKTEELNKIVTGKYMKEPAGDLLLKFWKPDGTNINKDNEAKLLEWMQKNGLPDRRYIPALLWMAQYSSLRAKAVEDLQLK
jgi:hypothetical protein